MENKKKKNKKIEKYVILIISMFFLMIGCGKKKESVEENIKKENIKKENVGEEKVKKENIENKEAENKKVENEEIEKKYPLVYGGKSLMNFLAKLRATYMNEDIKVAESEVRDYPDNGSSWGEMGLNRKYAYADIIFSYELVGNRDTKDGKLDTNYIYEKIANDGLVFVVNGNNKIDNLRMSDIKDIYNGKITNWKEVGGEDMEILPFQNNNATSSQMIFEKCFFENEDVPNSVKAMAKDNEGYLDIETAVYSNDVNAIGFMTYNYAKNMMHCEEHNMKIISIDGILANYQNIKNKKYPLIGDIYMVIRKDESSDSEARKLFDYVKSDDGKKIIIEAGLVEAE